MIMITFNTFSEAAQAGFVRVKDFGRISYRGYEIIATAPGTINEDKAVRIAADLGYNDQDLPDTFGDYSSHLYYYTPVKEQSAYFELERNTLKQPGCFDGVFSEVDVQNGVALAKQLIDGFIKQLNAVC